MSKDTWFSSDYHFFHGNIIRHCGRTFGNWWEMNEAIIKNHNANVKPNDDFYHLGDFSLGQPGKTIEILKRLNGNKYMIRGNHDKVLDKPEVQQYFIWIKDYYRLHIQDKDMRGGNQLIILCHYAMRVWDQSHRGESWQLFGHSHHRLPDDPNSLSIDVGVDGYNYRPISFNEIREIMSKKNINHY